MKSLLTHNQKSCWLAPKNCALGLQTGKGHNFHQNSHFRGPQARKTSFSQNFSFQRPESQKDHNFLLSMIYNAFWQFKSLPACRKRAWIMSILRAVFGFSTFSSSFLLQNRRTNEKEPDTGNPEVERSRFH